MNEIMIITTPEETWIWIIEFLSPLFMGIVFVIGLIICCFILYSIIMLIIAMIMAWIKYKNPFKFMKIITK